MIFATALRPSCRKKSFLHLYDLAVSGTFGRNLAFAAWSFAFCNLATAWQHFRIFLFEVCLQISFSRWYQKAKMHLKSKSTQI